MMKRLTAFQLYQGLVVLGLCAAPLFMGFIAYPLVVLVNRPYGGFLWSWSSAQQRYVVNDTLPAPKPLTAGDILVAVNGQSEPRDYLTVVAQELYNDQWRGCPAVPPADLTITYVVERPGEQLHYNLPLTCFTWSTLGQILWRTYPFALFLWLLGLLVFWANRQEEGNLAFAFLMSLLAIYIAKQASHNAYGLYSNWGQFEALAISVPMLLFLPPTILHVAYTVPLGYPSERLKKWAWVWYWFVPAGLLPLGLLQFWTPLRPVSQVLDLNGVTGFLGISLTILALAILCGRAIYLADVGEKIPWPVFLRPAVNQRIKAQARWIAVSTSLVAPMGGLLVVSEKPWWFETSPNELALLLIITLINLGVAISIIRYQTLPGRWVWLKLLLLLGITICVFGGSLVFANLSPSFSLFVVLFIFALILRWPGRGEWEQALSRLTDVRTVEQATAEQFAVELQQKVGLDDIANFVVYALAEKLDLTVVALWVRRGEQFVLQDTTADWNLNGEELGDLPLSAGAGLPAGLQTMLPHCYPLVVGEKEQIGLLALSERWSGIPFDEQDRPALTMMFQQVALSLNNALQIRALGEMMLRMEQVRDEEQLRLGTDFHNDVYPKIWQLQQYLQGILAQQPAGVVQNQAVLALAEVASIGQEIRKVINNELAPTRLSHLLGQRLAELQEQNSGRELTWQIDLSPEVDGVVKPEQSRDLVRICIAAVHNALKHASPQTITVRVSLENGAIYFVVADDGAGFVVGSEAERLRHNHYGLYVIAMRLRRYGAEVEIESRPGAGTKIWGYLPLMSV